MKRIIELSDMDYIALIKDHVQNHLALADSIIANSVPYEESLVKKLNDNNPFNWEYSKDTKKLIDSNRLFKREADLEATMSGYQSPITMIVHDIETQIENDCVKAVQKYGFDIDSEELYKALNYDREQYKKGYEAAEREYKRSPGEWIRKVDEAGFISYICSECGAEIEVEDCSDDKFCFNCGADMKGKTDEKEET